MQAAFVAALTIALALGTTIATTTFYLKQVDPGSEAADSAAEMAEQIDALHKECADLRRQLEASEQQAQPMQDSQRVLAGLGDEQIKAAVLRWLEKHGQTLPIEAAAKKEPPKINERAAFLALSDLSMSYNERLKVWAQVQKAGKLDDLLARLKEHAEQSPNDADAQAALGNALVQKINAPNVGGMERAVLGKQIDDAYAKALDLDPEHWEARYSRAIGQTFWPAFMGKQADAIQNFETLIEQQERRSAKPGYSSTYVLLGNVYAQQGKMDKAKEVWQRGLKQFPNDGELQKKLK